MKFEITDPIPFKVDEAYHILRDEMSALVPFMEDTESITVIKREDSDGVVKLTNHWQASMNKIPSAIRSFVKPEMLSWHDHVVWTEQDYTGRWELEALGSDKLFSCKGETSVIGNGEESTLKIVLEFEIYPEKVPGIPKFLAKKLGDK